MFTGSSQNDKNVNSNSRNAQNCPSNVLKPLKKCWAAVEIYSRYALVMIIDYSQNTQNDHKIVIIFKIHSINALKPLIKYLNKDWNTIRDYWENFIDCSTTGHIVLTEHWTQLNNDQIAQCIFKVAHKKLTVLTDFSACLKTVQDMHKICSKWAKLFWKPFWKLFKYA